MRNTTLDRWQRVNALLSALTEFTITTDRVNRGGALLLDAASDFDPIARAAEQRLCSVDAFDCFPAAPADFLSKTIH